MSEIQIITNGHARDLLPLEDLPPAARGDFDYIAGEDAYDCRFVAYRGNFYDVYDMMRTPPGSPLAAWDGYLNDTYFSGVVVRFVEDGERVQVGRFY
jgi:hypothetical protein